VITALTERDGTMPLVIGGRSGLASKEFTLTMVRYVRAIVDYQTGREAR